MKLVAFNLDLRRLSDGYGTSKLSWDRAGVESAGEG